MRKLRVLSLFAGIGGFDLGLERTGGFETVAFCEIDPFCRKVLAKHWPNVRQYEDVRTLTADTLARDGISVDVICGGFPCQDISPAGKKIGIDGIRSGLWSEYARLVCDVRPSFVIVENSSAILNRGVDRVLGDLAESGYDSEWQCIPASALGAPHGRDRFWLVAYPHDESEPDCAFDDEAQGLSRSSFSHDAANPEPRKLTLGRVMEGIGRISEPASWDRLWELENSPIGMGVANGFPGRMDRLRALGNAVVPQIPELIGRAILEARRAA